MKDLILSDTPIKYWERTNVKKSPLIETGATPPSERRANHGDRAGFAFSSEDGDDWARFRCRVKDWLMDFHIPGQSWASQNLVWQVEGQLRDKPGCKYFGRRDIHYTVCWWKWFQPKSHLLAQGGVKQENHRRPQWHLQEIVTSRPRYALQICHCMVI